MTVERHLQQCVHHLTPPKAFGKKTVFLQTIIFFMGSSQLGLMREVTNNRKVQPESAEEFLSRFGATPFGIFEAYSDMVV